MSDWLREAAEVLKCAGFESARKEAELLGAHVLGVSWGDLWTRLKEPIHADSLDALLERRRSGEPLAYITGSVVFAGVELACGPGALVPRPETETLVDTALELIADSQAPVVVDIGTGTGAIAIAIAMRHPEATVWATDDFVDAIRYAEVNARRHAPSVRVVRGDLYSALPDELRGSCDLIVSNPPYVPEGAEVAPDVRREPSQAVFAGPVGDEVLRRLARGANEWASPDGCVAFEIGDEGQAEAVADELRGFTAVEIRRDHSDRPRVVWSKR